MSINEAERRQDEFDAVLNVLSRYSPRDKKRIKAKNELIDNAKIFYKSREKNIEGFENRMFLYIKKISKLMVKDQIRLQHLTQALMNTMI